MLRTHAVAGRVMEERSLFVGAPQFVALIGCCECDGEAHVIRRAPYPFEGLEIRTFECRACGHQMERVTPSRAP
jgi:hypothetical protein